MTQMDEQEAKRGSEFAVSLLDSQMVQMLQDRFCLANNVYCVCLTRSEGCPDKSIWFEKGVRLSASEDGDGSSYCFVKTSDRK